MATFDAIAARFERAATAVDVALLAHARGAAEDAARQLAFARGEFVALGAPEHARRAETLAARLRSETS